MILKKFKSILLSLSVASIFLAVLIFPTSYAVQAKSPELTGAVKAFQLAPSVRKRPAPSDEIEWKDKDGKTIKIETFKGKVVLLNYWATWCAPCLRELPSMDRLQAQLGGDDFEVVAISIDRGGKTIARRTMKRLRLKNLALYIDKESASARKLGVRSMPTTYIFDKKGREVGKLEGAAEWDHKEAVALIKYFLANPDHADKLPPK